MKSFSSMHPITQAVWFTLTALCVMFSMNPIIAVVSFTGAFVLYIFRNGAKGLKTHLWFFAMWLGIVIINPLISHNGATVFLVINKQPITMESAVYGAVSGTVILSVLYLFRTFSQIMTSDRLMYLCGKLSPKLSLVMSMALRYTALFTQQTRKVQQYQKATGLYKEDNIIDTIRGGVRIFSIMLTWALEHGITTADRMTARGYGTGKRTQYAVYRFSSADTVMLILSVLFGAVTFTAQISGKMNMEFYPKLSLTEITTHGITGYILYGILVILPIVSEITENIKWKYYLSNI